MGLDIVAYSHLVSVGKHTDEWCEDEDHIQAYAYVDFPESFRGLPVLAERQAVHTADTFIDGGCYERTAETKAHSFRAGSYSGYGMWRDDLRRQFNPTTAPDQPFYELIWFADNEGTIGPDAARDLLAHFRQHTKQYQPPADWLTFYRERYQHWTCACELAAQSGLIDFH